MAYRPTNDIKENVIHRNTIFDSQGMVSCCTCGYCIKKTQDATLELTNFKAAPPIVNEQSIGSGVLEFSDYMIPNGSSGNYILSPQSIQQNLNIESLSDGFIYYPFLNCKGTTSVPLYDGAWGISVLENGFFTRPVKTYGVEVQSSYNQFNPGGFYPQQSGNNTFGSTGYLVTTFGNQFIGPSSTEPDNYSWLSVKNGPPSPYITYCTQADIDLYASVYPTNTSPVYPPLTNSGSLGGYFSYINNNDWSLGGFRANASCSNNVVSLMARAYFLDVSSYQFSYQYPNYSFYSSEKFIYSGPSPVGEPVSPFYGSNPFWGYDSVNKKMVDIYKGGYVLKDFTIDKFGKFSSSLTMLPINQLKYKEIYYNMFNNPLPGEDQIGLNYPYPSFRCNCTINMWFLDPDGTIEKILDQFTYNSIGGASAYGGVVSSIYGDNQELIDYRMNGYFTQLAYSSYNYPYQPVYPEEVSFGVNKTPNPFTDPVTYSEAMDQPYVPLKYTASKTDRTQITSTTDASGRTTLTIRNILWSGKILLKNSYSHNLGVNVPRLANGKFIPSAYQAVLKGGFESDAIISFQSKPLCKMVDITDRLRKVTELKVNLENYRKIPQTYMANYHAALQLYYATPAISEIFQTYNRWAQFTRYLGFSAFTGATYYSYYGNGYYIFGGYYFEFSNTEFYPPNINSENQFRVRNRLGFNQSDYYQVGNYDFSVIQKNIVPIDPPVITSYVAKAGRAYPDFGVEDRFKSCLLINGDKDVWKTGNEVQFVGLDYLVTNGGSGYTSVPTVTLSNGGGTGASAYARISNGRVVSVTTYNKGKDFTSNKTVVISGGGGNGATAVDISFTPFYSIYMEEIKDEKQTAGQTLIRIARTLQDANNGIYIPNIGLETLYKDRSLSVKFLYGFKDVSKENLPRYENVNLNDPVPSNVNADIIGGYYSKEAQWKTDFNGTLEFSFSHYSGLQISFKDKATNAYIQKYDYSSFQSVNNFFSEQGQSFLEVISLSPLKIKYRNLTFDGYGGQYYNSNYFYGMYNPGFEINDGNPQNTPKINMTAMLPFSNVFDSFIGLSMPGFQCDVILEEVVDEFIQEALPASFNQILQNVEFIQTSNMMNPRTPMEMINPEQCEHIGKVIDRKDCNCPKKWVRLCDVHGKTDWKKCMQCKDFKVSE